MIQLHMATTGVCNAACHFCVYPTPQNTRPKGTMSMDLYKKIVDEAATLEPIGSITFSALGEPLLDRHLAERIKYAKKVAPHWREIEVYTNGVYLTPERFEELKAAGVDQVCISLNAVNQEQHTKIMGLVGKFDQTVKNIEYAIANRGNVIIQVKAVCGNENFTEEHAILFRMKWGDFNFRAPQSAGHGVLTIERNWAGETRTLPGELPEELKNKCCIRALGQISVLWDGTVSLCCFDPLAKHNLGDLKEQTIREIYNAEWYTQFREDHSNDKAAKYEICAKCTRV